MMGGTINAQAYPEEEGEYPIYSTMANKNIVIKAAKDICLKYNNVELSSLNLCNKDSKNLTQEDQDKLLKAITSSSNNRIVITTGTDRMCEIAQNLQNNYPDPTCPIIFTGAIWPLANGLHSDGYDNLENAMFSNLQAPANTYIAMNDIYAPADKVYKDFENKIFKLQIT